ARRGPPARRRRAGTRRLAEEARGTDPLAALEAGPVAAARLAWAGFHRGLGGLLRCGLARRALGLARLRCGRRGAASARDPEEAAAIVRACAAEGVAVVPFGAGSGVCAGVLPSPRMVILDLKRMTRWRGLDGAGARFEVEAGATGITLEEQLQRRGHTLGHFP